MEIWKFLLAGLGVAMVLEGLPYFVSPPTVRGYLAFLERTSDGGMRTIGFALIVVGLLVAYVATR